MRLFWILSGWAAVWLIAGWIHPSPEPFSAPDLREWWIVLGSVVLGSFPVTEG